MPRIKQAAQEILNDVILPFWMSLKDPVHGGFYGLVDFDLRVDKTAEKGCILNSRILDIYATRVYSPALHRQLVFFDRHYQSIIDLYSYGHDIESSWLIDWGCALLGDEALTARIAAIDSDLARSVYRHAYRGSSLLNECERGVDDTTRVWWVQAEAVLGFVNEYEKSGGQEYAAAAAQIWHYITDKLADKRPGGEWFWSVDESGQPPAHRGTVEMPLPQRAYVYGTDQEGPPCRSLSCTPNTCARRPCKRRFWPARTTSPTGTTASTTDGSIRSSPASTSPWSGGSTLTPPQTPILWSGWASTLLSMPVPLS